MEKPGGCCRQGPSAHYTQARSRSMLLCKPLEVGGGCRAGDVAEPHDTGGCRYLPLARRLVYDIQLPKEKKCSKKIIMNENKENKEDRVIKGKATIGKARAEERLVHQENPPSMELRETRKLECVDGSGSTWVYLEPWGREIGRKGQRKLKPLNRSRLLDIMSKCPSLYGIGSEDIKQIGFTTNREGNEVTKALFILDMSDD
ncbi:hypothetical protein NDU88_003375 [Pleurodeles waltl]|uniref:Uncharacterized protein n=1 Tax=Pleurodeles waltl TaxID=8319 RepID=A0AAV7UEZ7_PLEWA|nr:hypothetical protein NDU88_003375 [Pleurodeles waltl]